MRITPVIRSCVCACFASLLSSLATGTASAAPTDARAFHHHIHNFSVDIWNRSNPDYALAHLHAKEMGYTLVTPSPAKGLNVDGIGYIKNHNAYYAPVRFDFGRRNILYFDYYVDGSNSSLIRVNRPASQWHPLDSLDLRLLKAYGCAKRDPANLTIDNFNLDSLQEYFFVDWIDGSKANVVANLKSRWVVQQLIVATLEGFRPEQHTALFFDDLAHEGHECANANAGDQGQFASWKEGQKFWLKQVAQAIRSDPTNKRYIFGNIWEPNSVRAGNTYLKWFSDGSLQLDHYYYEAGPQAGRGAEAKISAKSGYRYSSAAGYLPAEMVSISTTYGYYGTRVTKAQHAGYLSGRAGYFLNTLEVAATAALQGSWFGWYGSNNVDRRELVGAREAGTLVHTNDLQLLRAIPGWDNLAAVPLNARRFDKGGMVYGSDNSFFSRGVIYSRHFQTGELFAVYKNKGADIKLKAGESIMFAWFANHYFGRTDESAVSCLEQSGATVMLKCDSAIDRGIRISLKTNTH